MGLFLGCCLQQAGISFLILEKRKEPVSHSRSFGIHPVSLELLDRLDLAGSFIEQGIKITKGLAISNMKLLGSISFEHCPKPYNYILSLPQSKTEQILEEYLNRLNPDALLRGAEVVNFEEHDNSIEIQYKHAKKKYTVTGLYLVGADGKDSFIRKKAGIPFEGFSYPDTYIMGDFSDTTGFGSDAVIFLASGGLVESFPLPDHMRRWVIKTEEHIPEADRSDIEKRIVRRTGYDISGAFNTMLSSFGVQKLAAKSFVKGRIILAGDAAHIVSPIGGQGMNLGWLDAWDLLHLLKQVTVEGVAGKPELLNQYSAKRRKIARKAMRRAELNMRLGRKTSLPSLRNLIVWMMLNTPLNKLMVRLFTMRGLED